MSNAFVNNILARIFGTREPVKNLDGTLVRSSQFLERFAAWKRSPDYRTDFTTLYDSFCDAVIKNNMGISCNIYLTPHTRGIYFNENTGLNREVFAYLLDAMADKVEEKGYKRLRADSRYREVDMGIQQIDRYLFKPALQREPGEPVDQLYGNLTLELQYLNDAPKYLKLMSSVLGGQNFSEPLDFHALCVSLLAPENSGG